MTQEARAERRMLSDLLRRSRKGLPSGLHASLMAWLDWSGPAKEVTQRVEILACSAGCGGVQVGRSVALDHLIQSGLLFRQSVPPQATYLFKHPLVRDAEGYCVATHTRCFQCAGLSR